MTTDTPTIQELADALYQEETQNADDDDNSETAGAEQEVISASVMNKDWTAFDFTKYVQKVKQVKVSDAFKSQIDKIVSEEKENDIALKMIYEFFHLILTNEEYRSRRRIRGKAPAAQLANKLKKIEARLAASIEAKEKLIKEFNEVSELSKKEKANKRRRVEDTTSED